MNIIDNNIAWFDRKKVQKFESNNILTEITNLRFILNIIHKLLALDWYFGKRDKRF